MMAARKGTPFSLDDPMLGRILFINGKIPTSKNGHEDDRPIEYD